MKPKNQNNKVTLVFDNEDVKETFLSWWLDGGGDGGGNIDWKTEWTGNYPNINTLKISGTGNPIDENGNVYDPNQL